MSRALLPNDVRVAIFQLIQRVGDRRFATCDDVNEALPDRQLSGDEIEAALEMLDDHSVRVVDARNIDPDS